MNAKVGRGTRERGAILIQVAIAILALTAFSAFVVDYGVLWVARGQTQSAADAGALAGAIARSYDVDTDPPAADGTVFRSARNAALCASQPAACTPPASGANPGLITTPQGVWPSQAGATTAVEVPTLWPCPPGTTGKCVEVNVYRDGTHGSSLLPKFFGPLLGPTFSHGVRATATARIAAANSVECMRPFAVSDKWTENPLTTPDQFDRWKSDGTQETNIDLYTPPSGTDLGTGFRLPPNTPNDLGYEQTLISGRSTDTHIPPGWSLAVNLPDGSADGFSSGSSDFRNQITTCIRRPVRIGQYLPVENMGSGPTWMGVDDLIVQDPDADWDTGTKTVVNSCAPGTCPGGRVLPQSPRIVPLAVFDMDDFQHRRATNDNSPCPTGGECVHVVNILGYFVDHRGTGSTKDNVTGYLMKIPGTLVGGGAPTLTEGASFLTSIQLVR
jgi:Flp pilus assembly protein TadG